ncbi:MAG: hypothetical protein H6945_10985 [Zoogloeaceae bacterium]|nr:hypothetical protein [Rhodocyclaceae bacterium]MCP5236249.1 hypothetical protein [Zoogloeaceae bacterium]
MALLALVEPLAGIDGHGLDLRMTAQRTGQVRLQDDLADICLPPSAAYCAEFQDRDSRAGDGPSISTRILLHDRPFRASFATAAEALPT